MRTMKILLATPLVALCAVSAKAQQAPPAPVLPATYTMLRDSRVQIPSVVTSVAGKPQSAVDIRKLQGPIVLVLKSKSTCYAMRSYKFAQNDPTSDATTLKGSSTCELAANTHLKSAGVSVR